MLFYINHSDFHKLEAATLKNIYLSSHSKSWLALKENMNLQTPECLLSETYRLGHISKGKKKRSNVLIPGWISQEGMNTEADLLASLPCDSLHSEMLVSQVLDYRCFIQCYSIMTLMRCHRSLTLVSIS